MASARSGGRAGPRDEEANGDLDRSLQQMLRAIAEERSRAGLRQEISGLGESEAGASPPGGREGERRGGRGAQGAPPRAAAGSPRPATAAGWVSLPVRSVQAAAVVAWKPVVCCRSVLLSPGLGPFSFRSPRDAERAAVCSIV